MNRLPRTVILLALVGCPATEPPADGGLPPADSGSQAREDAGLVDSGSSPADTGNPPAQDSGAGLPDLGTPPVQDAGTSPADAGFVADAGIHCDGHAVGESWPAEDGCNTCSCTEDGRIRCTTMICPDNCEGHGLGESWPHEDGCNSCTCTVDGIVCTRRRCPPAPDHMLRCNVSMDCVLADDTCCGVCGEPALDDLQGVNQRFERDLHDHYCGDPPPPCPLCPSAPAPGHFIAVCEENVCVGRSVYDDDLALDRCHVDADCTLRANTCCGSCPQAYTAQNATAVGRAGRDTLSDMLCNDMTCEACGEPDRPPRVEAYCNEANRCRLRPAGP